MGCDGTQPHNAYIHTSQYDYITNTQYLTFRKVTQSYVCVSYAFMPLLAVDYALK